MKTTKPVSLAILWLLVGIVTLSVGLVPCSAEEEKKSSDPNSTESKTETKPATPEDKGEETKKEEEPKEPEDPNMVSLNLKEVEMKNIIEKIADWTDKGVVPVGDVMKQKLTIYLPKKVHKMEALGYIYSVLRTKGYVAETTADLIYLKPIGEAKMGLVPTIPASQPLASIANKEEIVNYFWHLDHYSPGQMYQHIEPLIGEHGHVSADETTGTVMVIDTVANLMRIERIIKEFDVPQAEQMVSDVFQIHSGDPIEIVQTLRLLMGEDPHGGSRRSSYSSRRPPSTPRRPPSGGSKTGSSVIVGPSDLPLTLIPEPKRNWIIARGAPQDMEFIREWIEKLDLKDEVESEYETIPIVYANTREVASRIEDALQDMPGRETRLSVIVRPLEQSRQIMIFGREDLRMMVKQLIAEIDMPTGEYEQKTFELKHQDPEVIKANIESLYADESQRDSRYRFYSYRYGQQQNPADIVKVIAFTSMSTVTVTATPENMRKIEAQIEEWDVPLDVDQVKPRIIELKNSDPVQMTELLTKLFSEDDDSSTNFFRIFFSDDADNKKKIIGPLYGKLTFEEVPGTRKIIVISKIPQAYEVVEALIRELDMQEMAEVPMVVPLQYADPESLAERLNALFNERGTPAKIRMAERGLSDYSASDDLERSTNSQNNNNNNNQNDETSEYTPWWTTGSTPQGQEAISNVIGRIRFIPDNHSKSILVLTPPEYQQEIKNTIVELDVPGRQVMIKAVIMMVDHSSMTSLGIQLSSNPSAFGEIGENAITTYNSLAGVSTGNNVIPAPDTPLGIFGDGGLAGINSNVYALIDFLEKNLDARILNQQTLWTKDNEESRFFRGEVVSIQHESSIAANGLSNQSLKPTAVGMTLQVRPSITPGRKVNMEVIIELSQLTDQLVNEQPIRSMMDSKTQMSIEDGRTLMLGGILFQRDYTVIRKVPGFGDIPLLGALFRHKELAKANSEMIIFITPYVVDEDENQPLLAETQVQIDAPLQRLSDVRAKLESSLAELMGNDETQKSKENPKGGS